MSEDAEDKTEEPTGKRLSEARKEGNVPQSIELRTWGSLAGTLVVVGMLAPGLATDLQRLMLPFVEQLHSFSLAEPEDLRQLLSDVGWAVLLKLLLPLIIMAALPLAVSVAQTQGLMWVPKKLMPDFNKINPWEGLKRMFSARSLIELAKSVIKMVVVAALLTWIVWPDLSHYENLARLDLMSILAYLHDKIYALTLAVLLVVTAVAGADYLYQRFEYNKKMRMTKQEVRDEFKQTEGDPMVKGRLRSLRMARARQRMMTAVPKADVVITNPTHYAVALKYDMESMGAPVLVAKGVDLIAKRIRELANENEVPIVENPPLARALYAAVELDHEVPPEHYKAVAEVIGYVMRMKGKLAN